MFGHLKHFKWLVLNEAQIYFLMLLKLTVTHLKIKETDVKQF